MKINISTLCRHCRCHCSLCLCCPAFVVAAAFVITAVFVATAASVAATSAAASATATAAMTPPLLLCSRRDCHHLCHRCRSRCLCRRLYLCRRSVGRFPPPQCRCHCRRCRCFCRRHHRYYNADATIGTAVASDTVITAMMPLQLLAPPLPLTPSLPPQRHLSCCHRRTGLCSK